MSMLGKLSQTMGLITLVACASVSSLVAQPAQAIQPHLLKVGKLPTTFVNAVLHDAYQRLGVPISQLRVRQVENQTWPNGCLGLPSPGVCIKGPIYGHRVTVRGGGKLLVYRTDATGANVKLEKESIAWPPHGGHGPVILPDKPY